MITRLAVIEDLPQIKELEQKWIQEGISPYMKPDPVKKLSSSIKKGLVFVAENKEKIVGYTKILVNKATKTLKVYNLRKGQRYIDVDAIYVAKGYRRKGVGKKLLKLVEDYAMFNRIKLILLSADNANVQGIIKFYERQGFKTHFVRMFKYLEQ